MTVSLYQLKQDFLAWCVKFRARGTAQQYARHLDRFCRHVGDVDAAALKPMALFSWGKTWHQFQAVQRLYSWGVHTADVLERNPFAKVERPPAGKRKRILDRRTLARMMWRSSPPFRRFLFALKESLARPQEIRLAWWEHLVWPSKPIGLEQALAGGKVLLVMDEYKSRARRKDSDEPRVIPISPRLGRVIARLAREGRAMAGPIFLNHDGQAWTSNAVRCRMKWLRKKLGLVKDHRGEHVVAYTLRHTVATWAAAAGIRDKILAELMGHTSTRTTARYQHLQVEHLQAALATLRRSSQSNIVTPWPRSISA